MVIGGIDYSRYLGRFLSKTDFGLVLGFRFKSLERRYGPPVLTDGSEIGPLPHPGFFKYFLEVFRSKTFLLFNGKGQF